MIKQFSKFCCLFFSCFQLVSNWHIFFYLFSKQMTQCAIVFSFQCQAIFKTKLQYLIDRSIIQLLRGKKKGLKTWNMNIFANFPILLRYRNCHCIHCLIYKIGIGDLDGSFNILKARLRHSGQSFLQFLQIYLIST